MAETLGADFFADPQSYYRRWRARGPVHRVRFPDGTDRWVVIGYPEARAALADSRLCKDFSRLDALISAQRGEPGADPRTLALLSHLLNSDPPAHTRLRKLVTKAFTARRIALLRPRVEQIADELLDALRGRERTDLIAEFAVPLPITVICEILGVAVTDRDSFRRWTTDVVGVAGREQQRRESTAAMAEFLRDLVRDKLSRPGEDLLSALAHTTDDGDRLTPAELVSMAFLLLVAGHETTVNLIGNGALALLRHPEHVTGLRADPTLIPAAVEEFLRFDGPVGLSMARFTAAPITLGDTEIPAGEIVYVALAAADHDPSRFGRPDVLDPAADRTGHLAFGHGIHHCLGAPLARMEAAVAFTALLRRFPALRPDPDAAPLRWHESTLIRGLVELPVLLRD
ncbi:cytochrome P450 family protein [Nocardia macrotermitis]|uniref:Cytochrome P450 107B1 n=1 Tax=Nocardia macrotermitis TaxID=2585198 RepID=A0A7K0CUH8_9NOCA|nr:cytochrome P450 [Nocardia macrotermitis]MQY17140.1 Cytochrome P450 107B1 [Nocardia macrotermitis]